jgi:hypothetical protein
MARPGKEIQQGRHNVGDRIHKRNFDLHHARDEVLNFAQQVQGTCSDDLRVCSVEIRDESAERDDSVALAGPLRMN